MRKQKTDIYYAILTNAAHLVVCFVCYLLRVFDLYGVKSIQIVVLIVDLLIWIASGVLCALGKNDNNYNKGALFALYTLLPIAIVTSVAAIIGSSVESSISWGSFFFIGSIVNFWNRPFIAISGLVQNNAYLFFFTVLVILYAIIFVTYYNGVKLNRTKRRRRNRQKKEETLSNKT